MSDDWMFVNESNEQEGPVSFAQLKALYAKKAINKETYVWNEDMDAWTEVMNVPGLEAKLKPATAGPPPALKGGPPPKGGAPPRAVVESVGRAAVALPSASTGSTKKAAPVGKWVEKRTADGVPYYFNEGSEAVTWDIPDELRGGGAAFDDGSWIWFPDENEGYIPAKLLSKGKTAETEAQLENGQRVKTKKPCFPLKKSSLNRVEQDLVLLDNLDEGLIGYNLKQRYYKNQIYTNIGTILISINPYQLLPIYSLEVIMQYKNRGNRTLAPHVYEIADAALTPCKMYNESQSILISGESGAGKTEATKQCLNYLAEVAGSEKNVEALILAANPILEAFGNAKTLRNDNSSRFGRFTQVSFDKKGTISYARIENYLLEKSRVTYQQEGERNYHIFYQIFTDANFVKKLGLTKMEYFAFINKSGCYRVDGVDDGRDFQDVITALKNLNVTGSEIDWICNLVGAVLHVGNVGFKKTELKGAEGSTISDPSVLKTVAKLLQVDETALLNALVTRSIEVKSEGTMTLPLKTYEALTSASALAKSIYGNLFDWLVVRINKSLAAGDAGGSFIGILDIFGFEIFKKNSFEQLCINFTNEKLQQLFNEHTFKQEEALYVREGVKFGKIDYIDNQPILDLIEDKKGPGIMILLDDCNKMPANTDTKFVNKIDGVHEKNVNYLSASKTRIGATGFTIKHYAGEVVYDADGFLEKNKDLLYQDLYDVMSASKDKMTSALFPPLTKDMRKNFSLGGQFRQQLNNLMTLLRSTEPHYIRCIKPNTTKKKGLYTSQMVLEQLRYSGVFEAVSIRKNGFPFRYTFPRFEERYKCLTLRGGKFTPLKGRNPMEKCTEILKMTKQDFAAVQVGKSMLLYKSEQHRILELLRALALEKVCTKIQSWYRGVLARKWYQKVRGLCASLKKACDTKNKATLERAITNFSNQMGSLQTLFNVEPKDLYQAKRILHALNEWDRLAEELGSFLSCDVSDDSNFELLKDVVWKAEKIADLAPTPSHADMYNQAKTKWEGERKLRMDPAIEKALRLVEREHMLWTFAECNRLKYKDERLLEIQELSGMSEEQLLKEQYKVAKKNGMTGRAVLKEIELKERYLDTHGKMIIFDQDHYMRLRHKVDFGNSVLLTFSREQIMDGMLKHSKSAIPISLTILEEPERNKKACFLFKALLMCMGERKTSTPDLQAYEIVSNAYEDPSLRAEVYCQLMKQLTENPESESKHRGWAIFGLCLLVFPPPPDFENFVLMFIRRNCPDREKYTQQCHKIIYTGGSRMNSADEVNGRIMTFLNTPFAEEDWGAAEEERAAEQAAVDKVKATLSPKVNNNKAKGKGGAATTTASATSGKGGAKGPVAKKPPAPVVDELPEGWTEQYEGREVFYYNEYTGESQWDRPTM